MPHSPISGASWCGRWWNNKKVNSGLIIAYKGNLQLIRFLNNNTINWGTITSNKVKKSVTNKCGNAYSNLELHIISKRKSRDGWLSTGWTTRVRFQARGKLSLPPLCPDWIWGPSSFLSNWYRRLFSGGKWPEHEALHSPPSNVEVKNFRSFTSTPPYVLWLGAWAQGQPYLTFTLIMCSRVLFEKLTAAQLVKKFIAFYRNRWFIVAFSRARH
jgi:hypothetical protein